MQPTVEAVDQKEEKIPMGVCTLPTMSAGLWRWADRAGMVFFCARRRE